MSSIYLIKEKTHPYDNYYLTDRSNDGDVLYLFDNKAEAEAKYQSLLVDQYQSAELSTYDVFNHVGDDDAINRIERFYFEQTGKETQYLTDVCELDLSDEDIKNLMLISGVAEYDLIEETEDAVYYLLWINGQNDYFKKGNKPIIFDNPDLDLGDDEFKYTMFEALNDAAPTGTLAELSHQSDDLEKHINDSKELVFFDGHQLQTDFPSYANALFYTPPTIRNLTPINDCLIKPWYEVKPFSLAELKKSKII